MNEIENAIWQFNNNMTYVHEKLMFSKEYQLARRSIVKLFDKELSNGWIPVSEKLPEKTGWYVTAMEGYNYSKWTDRKYFNAKKKIFTGTKMKVLAWQEQAQPYMEVEE